MMTTVLEAEVGIEPAWTDLQSAALPLCHSAELLLYIFALNNPFF